MPESIGDIRELYLLRDATKTDQWGFYVDDEYLGSIYVSGNGYVCTAAKLPFTPRYFPNMADCEECLLITWISYTYPHIGVIEMFLIVRELMSRFSDNLKKHEKTEEAANV